MPLAVFDRQYKKNPDGSAVLGPDGRPIFGLAINVPKLHVRSYWLTPPPGDTLEITLTAGAPKATINYLIDSQGHFDWATIIGSQTAPYLLEFYDAQCQRNLQNRPIHSTLLVGSGRRQFRLPAPYFFNVGDSARELVATVQRLGADSTLTLTPYGRRFYHRELPPELSRELARQHDNTWRYYSYFLAPNEVSFAGVPPDVAGGGSTVFTFEMDSTADFEVQKALAVSTGAFTYVLRERDKGAGGRTLSTGIVRALEGFGNAEFPFIMEPYMLERKKQLFLEITDVSGTTNTIFVALAGKRFDFR